MKSVKIILGESWKLQRVTDFTVLVNFSEEMESKYLTSNRSASSEEN